MSINILKECLSAEGGEVIATKKIQQKLTRKLIYSSKYRSAKITIRRCGGNTKRKDEEVQRQTQYNKIRKENITRDTNR